MTLDIMIGKFRKFFINMLFKHVIGTKIFI